MTGRVHAVEDVTFALQPGETLALIGRVRLWQVDHRPGIIKLVEPTRGSVKFEVQELTGSTRCKCGPCAAICR